MRKVIALCAAAALMVASLGEAMACVEECPWTPPAVSSTSSGAQVGGWAVACGGGAFASLLIGTLFNAGNPATARQLTITEAGWFAVACPVVLPLALITATMCPDSKATRTVARLAYLYVQKHPGADQSAFTNAYVEACHGTLSRATVKTLRGLI
ncbi:MAG: hypothetical protein OJF62_003370 [Pseudolabrys sp.]|jgi:hypothetical protein|nr:hypothetical protein [Pseudolabrys sp.]